MVLAREHFLPYDERFRGYGMNKCIHLRALAKHHRQGQGQGQGQGKNSEEGRFRVLVGHCVVADCHDRSTAHALTYGCDSGYRKHVVAALYRCAAAEQDGNRSSRCHSQGRVCPPISRSTAALLPKDTVGSRVVQNGSKCKTSAGLGGTRTNTAVTLKNLLLLPPPAPAAAKGPSNKA